MSAIRRLTSLEELDDYLDAPAGRRLWIFKHSLTCGISTAAWRPFQQFVEQSAELGDDHAVIEIQNARPVSAEVATRFGVRHESPQALLIRDGEVVWHASHWEIDREALQSAR